MAKLNLTDLTSLASETTAVQTLTANNTLIETALENTLSRDGTGPNYMTSNLDMNSYRVTNLPTPSANSDAATKVYVDELVGSLDADRLQAAIDAEPLAIAAQAAAEAAQTAAAASAAAAAGYVGAAVSAQRWTTARTITFSGVSTSASPAWDGSTDLTIPLALVDDSVGFGKLQNISTNTLLGRLTASTGDVESLTPAQVNTMLPVVASGLNGLVPSFSGADADKFLRGDGNWSAVPTNKLSTANSTLVANGGILRLGSDGYKRMWGRYTGGSSSPTVTFPEAFTSAVFGITVTPEGTSAGEGGVFHATIRNGATTLTNFGVYCSLESGGTDTFQASSTCTFYWEAWGI